MPWQTDAAVCIGANCPVSQSQTAGHTLLPPYFIVLPLLSLQPSLQRRKITFNHDLQLQLRNYARPRSRISDLKEGTANAALKSMSVQRQALGLGLLSMGAC